MKIPYEERFSIDKKASAIKFLKTCGHAAAHHYKDLGEVVHTSAAKCIFHGKACVMPAATPDLLIAGPPCSPYSSQRATRTSMRCAHEGGSESSQGKRTPLQNQKKKLQDRMLEQAGGLSDSQGQVLLKVPALRSGKNLQELRQVANANNQGFLRNERPRLEFGRFFFLCQVWRFLPLLGFFLSMSTHKGS